MWFTWAAPADGSEPYGQLTDLHKPLGYHVAVSYDATSGLPTRIQGDSYVQVDGTTRQPTVTVGYDTEGDVTSLNKGNGATTITYDPLNRPFVVTDADGISTYTCYYADGSVAYTETAAQHALDGASNACQSPAPRYAVAYNYDADGNPISETHHHGGTYNTSTGAISYASAGTTQRFYDGADRLVEVELPSDSTYDAYTNPWITRYIYDLSQNGTVSGANPAYNYDTGSVSFQAHGGLFKTEELLPAGQYSFVTPGVYPVPAQSISNTVFRDLKATAYDALERPIADYSVYYNAGSGDYLSTRSYEYDAVAASQPNGISADGLLSKSCDQLQICKTFLYNETGEAVGVNYSDGKTPNRTIGYDPDMHRTSVGDTYFGTQTYGYNADGELVTSQEPSGGGVTSPALITHEYYGDGLPKQIDVSSSALNQNGLMSAAYRPDGLPQANTINYAALSNVAATVLQMTYTSAGRLLSRSPSGPGATATPSSITYDLYGRPNKYAFAAGQLNNLQFSAEDDLLAVYSAPQSGTGAWSTYSYTTRGEEVSGTIANGVPTNISGSWNDVLGLPYDGYGIDGDGRLAGSYAFDAENHTISATLKTETQEYRYMANTYTESIDKWGPSGHPYLVGSASATGVTVTTAPIPSQFDTLHWDDNKPLFETNASGAVDQVFLGATGAILPQDSRHAGLTMYDRGPGGTIVSCENSSGYSSMASNNASLQGAWSLCAGGTGQMPSFTYGATPSRPGIGVNQVALNPRPDGIFDGVAAIQGVRSYDPKLGIWTTPDAFPGYIGDPMSSKPYIWNSDNPIAYQDPSGNCSVGGQTIACGYSAPSRPSWINMGYMVFMAPTDYALQNRVDAQLLKQIIANLRHNLACPGGKYDVAVYNGSLGAGLVGSTSIVVTAYGDIYAEVGGGPGAGLGTAGGFLAYGNVVGVTPGFASKNQINRILSGWSFNADISAGVAVGKSWNLSGTIQYTGAGWPSGSLTFTPYGFPLPRHLNCSRTEG